MTKICAHFSVTTPIFYSIPGMEEPHIRRKISAIQENTEKHRHAVMAETESEFVIQLSKCYKAENTLF
jgi:hypothetical protein